MKKNTKKIIIIIVVMIVIITAGVTMFARKNGKKEQNDTINEDVKIEITESKEDENVKLQVTSVDGLISLSSEQISKMTDEEKKHVISLTEHLSVNKEHGTHFSKLEEAINYEFENGIITENSEDSFWSYVESHGGSDTWLRGTLEYCFGNTDGIYKMYEVINPDGEVSDSYIVTKSGTYTFTVKDLLYNKEYKKSIDVTVDE